MKSKRLVVISSLVALCMAATVALAGGSMKAFFDDVVCEVLGNKVKISGTLKNIDKDKNTTIKLRLAVKAKVQCYHDNNNNNKPVGKAKWFWLEETESADYKKGQDAIDFVLKILFKISSDDACKKNQKAEIVALKVKECQLKAFQDGKLVAEEDCTDECKEGGSCDDSHFSDDDYEDEGTEAE